MKLALDNVVSRRAAHMLKAAGHIVVYHAEDEHDEWWFREACEAGAECFVSCDWDIVLMADNAGKLAMRLNGNGGVRGAAQAAVILRRLEAIRHG